MDLTHLQQSKTKVKSHQLLIDLLTSIPPCAPLVTTTTHYLSLCLFLNEVRRKGFICTTICF